MGTDYWEDIIKVDCDKRASDYFFKEAERLDLSDVELNMFREHSARRRHLLLDILKVDEKLKLVTDPMERRRGNDLRRVIGLTLDMHKRCLQSSGKR